MAHNLGDCTAALFCFMNGPGLALGAHLLLACALFSMLFQLGRMSPPLRHRSPTPDTHAI